jgi:hypothetical protein
MLILPPSPIGVPPLPKVVRSIMQENERIMKNVWEEVMEVIPLILIWR